MILRRVVDVHLLDLPDGVRDEMHLDVVEPHSLVFGVRPREARVVGLVRDPDHVHLR
jgi:hypothetical protein